MGKGLGLFKGAGGSGSTGDFNYFLSGVGTTSLPTAITTSVRNIQFEQTGIPTLSIPTVEGNNLTFEGNSLLASLSFPSLTSSFILNIDNNDLLTTLSIPILSYANTLSIQYNATLASVSLPAFIYANQVSIIDNASLTTITFATTFRGLNVVLTGNALSQANVDDILDKLDDGGLSNGIVDLTGGTNATPSAAGLTSKSNLEGKGWTVTVN